MAIDLPDIPQTAYDEYEKERLQREFEQKNQQFTLQNVFNQKLADVQSLVGGAASAVGGAFSPAPPTPTPPVEQAPAPAPEPAPPPPLPEPTPAPEPAAPSQVAFPEPTPASAPPSMEMPPEVLASISGGGTPAPMPQPPDQFTRGRPVPMPTTLPDGSSPLDLPVRSTTAPPPAAPSPSVVPPSPSGGGLQDWITSTMGAAARSGADLQAFAGNLSTSGDLVGNAFGAALKAGANMDAFSKSLTAPPAQGPTQPAAVSAPAGTGITPAPGGDLQDYARQAAAKYGIDPDIFVRQIQQESGFNPRAKSGAGAQGIAQFMPATAAGMGVDPSDPYSSLDGAARLMAQNLQKYGDYGKALAAYNAGGGAVDKYGGIPPFEETQRYVSTILGGAKEKLGAVASGVGSAVRGGLNQISQFGDSQLTADEAYAACGPAAAVRFAQLYGRNPSLREATDLAKTVGWTSGGGMAGLGSEAALMQKMGIPVKTVGADWQTLANEAQSGNPVTISTPGHYFTADGYDPTSGAFHVGRSGTDLRQGSEWMTPAQMEGLMGKVQGGLLADNPGVPAPSLATRTTPTPSTPADVGQPASPSPSDQPLIDQYGRLTPAATGQTAASVGTPTALEQPQSPVDKLKSAFGDFLDSLGTSTAQPAGQPAQSQPIPSDTLTNPLGTRNALTPTSAALTGQPAGGIAEPTGGPTGAAGVVDQMGKGLQGLASSDLLPTSVLQGVETGLGQQILGGPNAPLHRLGTAIEDLAPGVESANIPLASGLGAGALKIAGGLIGAPTLTDSMQTMQDLTQKYGDLGMDPAQMTPEDRQAYGNAIIAIGGVTMGGGAEEGVARALSRVTRAAGESDAAFAARLAAAGIDRNRPGTAPTLGDIRPDRRAPRLSEGAVPVTGESMLGQALDALNGYPPDVAGTIRDFALTADAPPSDVATTVRRWMEQNPPALTEGTSPAAREQIVQELNTNVRSVGGPAMPGGAQPGQRPLFDILPPEVQETLPRGEGEGGVPSVSPEDPGLSLDARRKLLEQRLINQRRAEQGLPPAAEMYGPTEQLPRSRFGGDEQTPLGLTGDEYTHQMEMAAGEGGFDTTSILRDYVPTAELEARYAARLQAQREAAAATRAERIARGESDIPSSGLTQEGLGSAAPLDLPSYVSKPVADLLERGNQSVSHAAPVDEDLLQLLANKSGETVDRLKKVWKPGDNSAAVLRSANYALNESKTALEQAQQVLKIDPTNVEARADVVRQLTRQQALQETLGGRRPTAGAMLDSMSAAKPVEGAKATAEQLAGMAKRAGKMSVDDYVEKLSKVDMTDPDKVASLAKIAKDYTFGDRALALWYFNLLSRPLTQIRNVVGNTVTGLTAPLENVASSAWDPVARKFLGETGPRQRYLGETGAQYAGIAHGLGDTGSAMLDALKYGTSTKAGEIGRLSHEPFVGTKFEPLGYPGRALEAADVGFNTVNKNMSFYAQAYRRAAQEGLTGDAFKARVSKLINAPDQAMLDEAAATGEYRTFHNDNRFATGLNALVDRVPGNLGRFVIPFSKTPLNIASYMLERTPLAFGKIGLDFRTAEGRAALRAKGSGDLADRLGRATVGTGVMLEAGKQAWDGNLTGSAPDASTDPAEFDRWRREGIQADSFKNPVTGDWTSYAALEPYAGLLHTGADTALAIKKGNMKDPADIGSAFLSGGMALGHGLTNVRFADQLTQLLDIMKSGSSTAGIQQFGEGLAGSAVPGLLRTVTDVTDTARRDTRPGLQGLLDAAMKNVPGLSGNVPEHVSAFGQPEQRSAGGLDALLNPMPGITPKNDPVELELDRLKAQQDPRLPRILGNYQIEPGFVGKQYNVGGVIPTTLSDVQQKKYQAIAGKASYDMLHTLVGTQAWNDLPDLEKAQTVDQIYTAAHQLARAQMDPEMAQQAADELNKALTQRVQRVGAG